MNMTEIQYPKLCLTHVVMKSLEKMDVFRRNKKPDPCFSLPLAGAFVVLQPSLYCSLCISSYSFCIKQ